MRLVLSCSQNCIVGMLKKSNSNSISVSSIEVSIGSYDCESVYLSIYLPTEVNGSLSNICTMSPTPCPAMEYEDALRILVLADPGGLCMGE